MDMNLIALKVDPGQALVTLEQAKAKLQAAEIQGKAAAESMAGVSNAFRSLAQALQQEQSALTRTNTLHDQLTTKASGLVGSFNGIAQAIQRERDMLDAIHGPSQRIARDTEVLNALLAKGAIDAEQYAAQMARVKAAQSSGGNGTGSGALQGLGSQLGLGGLGGAGIAAGVAFGVKELAQIDDKYTDLSNHALKFVDASHSVGQVLADQRDLANALHQDLGATLDSYDDIRDATDKLNLSYNEGIRLTKTFSEVSQLDYKSTQQLTQEFLQLSVAFETGGRIGGTLRQLFRDFPTLATQLQQSLGLTEKQMVDMAMKGQLSFDQVAKAAYRMGPALQDVDNQFKQRTETLGQYWHEFVDAVEAPIDIKFAQQLADPAQQAAKKIQELADQMREGDGVWKESADLVNKYNAALKETIETARKDIWTEQINLVGELQKGYGLLTEVVGKFADKTAAAQKAAHEEAIEMAKLRAEMANEAQILKLQMDLNPEFNGLAGVKKSVDDTANSMKEWAKTMQDDLAKQQDDEAKRLAELPRLYDEWELRAKDAISGIDTGWKQIVSDATDSGKHIRDAMTGAFTDVQNSIADMVMKGKFDLGSLASEIESILVKLAVQQVSGSILGAIGGGMTGFDYLTPGGRGPALPGFARGGDMLVGGSGAPDSKLAMFRVSPGESIHVRTPEQRVAAANAAASGPSPTINNFNYDPRRLRSGKDLQAGVLEVLRTNPAAVRQLLGIH